jgi:hypothetical protein
MSTEPLGDAGGGVGGWVAALVGELALADPAAHARLLAVVGDRRARLRLDDDACVVAVVRGRLSVLPAETEPVDGEGGTSRAVVLAILDGRLEADDALRSGLVEARGSVDGLVRILHAIEILIDCSVRAPRLRALADLYRADGPPPTALPPRPATTTDRELALLDRLGLL